MAQMLLSNNSLNAKGRFLLLFVIAKALIDKRKKCYKSGLYLQLPTHKSPVIHLF